MAAAGSGAAEDDLEKQAQEMAEKALPASLPATVRAAKLPAVKQKILARLRAQRGEQASRALVPSVPVVPAPPVGVAPPPPPGIAPPPPPPNECEKSQVQRVEMLKIEGVEGCGDELWFADHAVRARLRESIVEAHKEQKILVGAPADEVQRICPQDGRVLGAGGVLRLGGAHLGGYGETDVAYAYRQLSRALHPDKNPDLPTAPAAFHRLSVAADELRQGLHDQRALLQALVGAMGGVATPDMLERPQEALVAEASRMLTAVCSIAGEGNVSGIALDRSLTVFTRANIYHNCQPQGLLSEWFDKTRLLEFYATPALRAAYDCAPKRFRAQLLCLLNRAVVVEATRCNDCVRGNWSGVMQTFPELGIWREFREQIRRRVWDISGEPLEQSLPSGARSDRHEKCRDQEERRSRSREGRRRRRGWDPEDAGRPNERLDDRGRVDAYRGRDPFREKGQPFRLREQQRDREWASRWQSTDDHGINQPPVRECEPEPVKRSRREIITMHPQSGQRACRWGRKWRAAIAAILPSGMNRAVPGTDSELRKLAAALWKNIAKWAASGLAGNEVGRGLGLFRADNQTSRTFGWDGKTDSMATQAARSLEPGASPAVWAFIPASDLLLVVGEGLVGITGEGVFADNRSGHKPVSFKDCYKKPATLKANGKGDNNGSSM